MRILSLPMLKSGFQLKIVEGPGQGQIIPLVELEVGLGRANTFDEPQTTENIYFFEATVSRVHATLVWDDKTRVYFIQHRSKTNQTKVNDSVVKERRPLWPGDLISLGKLVLEMQKADRAAALAASSSPALSPAPPGPAAAAPPAGGRAPSPRVAEVTASPADADATVASNSGHGPDQESWLPQNLEGRRLGSFTLGRVLGRGSVGTVYLAHHDSLNLDRAIKVLAPDATRDANFVQRFQREARIAAKLRHPNIIQVLDVCISDGLCYLVMEYLGARSLQDIIDEHKEPFPVALTVAMVEQVLSALEHAHGHGVVHRDVKPANILLDEVKGQIALSDFSIAHIKDGMRVTTVGVVLGTPEYMAPEMFDGQTSDARVDLYAVGVILYEMLTGMMPFTGKSNTEIIKAQIMHVPPPPSSINPEVPAFLSDLTMKALEKDPQDRFSCARDMRKALRGSACPPAEGLKKT